MFKVVPNFSQFRTTINLFCIFTYVFRKEVFLSLCRGRKLRGSSCSFLLSSNLTPPRKSGQWECNKEEKWIQRNHFQEEWSPFTGKRINTIKSHRFQFLYFLLLISSHPPYEPTTVYLSSPSYHADMLIIRWSLHTPQISSLFLPQHPLSLHNKQFYCHRDGSHIYDFYLLKLCVSLLLEEE